MIRIRPVQLVLHALQESDKMLFIKIVNFIRSRFIDILHDREFEMAPPNLHQQEV